VPILPMCGRRYCCALHRWRQMNGSVRAQGGRPRAICIGRFVRAGHAHLDYPRHAFDAAEGDADL